MAAPKGKPRAGPQSLAFVVVAGGVLLFSWLALRTMGKRLGEAGDAAPAQSATPIARIDLVLRVDGIDVSAEGAPVCRDNDHTAVHRAPDGGSAGSFDESALRDCLVTVLTTIRGKRPVATVTRAGEVPTTQVDALLAAIKRAGITEIFTTP